MVYRDLRFRGHTKYSRLRQVKEVSKCERLGRTAAGSKRDLHSIDAGLSYEQFNRIFIKCNHVGLIFSFWIRQIEQVV